MQHADVAKSRKDRTRCLLEPVLVVERVDQAAAGVREQLSAHALLFQLAIQSRVLRGDRRLSSQKLDDVLILFREGRPSGPSCDIQIARPAAVAAHRDTEEWSHLWMTLR